MNNDLLKVFETESDYDSAKDGFVYPTVSYVRDVDEVRYMEATKALLPRNIDTTGYATEFVYEQTYPQEALVFKAIYDMYNYRYITIYTDTNTIRYYDGGEIIIDISNEPLYIDYLSKINSTWIGLADNRIELYNNGIHMSYNGEISGGEE